jgi:hypothetical protein
MPVLSDGTFTITIPAEDLAKGLRPSRRNPRNVKFLTSCYGAVGLDNVLQTLNELEDDRIDITTLGAITFPYPQLFVFTNLIILCTQTDIYELVAGVLNHQLNVAPGILWSAVDLNDYVYMSNGVVAVRRLAESKVWETTTDLPVCSAICNFNGQVLIGAPGVIW